IENCSVPNVIAAVGFNAAAPVAPTGTTPTDISGVIAGTFRRSRIVLKPPIASFEMPETKLEYSCTTVELFLLTPTNWFDPRRKPVFWESGLFWNVLLFREKDTLSVWLIS